MSWHKMLTDLETTCSLLYWFEMLLSLNWVDFKILGVILIVIRDSQPPESNLLIELI